MRVVVADNDPDALELAVTDLARAGHDVVGQAADGDECLAVVRATQPDVAVLDYRMPGRDGMEVATVLASELPGVRLLIYSNYTATSLRRQASALGATFIPKGNLRTLRAAVGAPGAAEPNE